MSILGSMRGGGYKNALSTAQRTLKLHRPFKIDDCIDTAMRAMNECGHWAKKGMIRLVYNGRFPVIQIVVGQQVYEPNHVQQLLMFAEEHSVMEFLRQGSGIGQAVNTDPSPF